MGESRIYDSGYPKCAVFPLQGICRIMADDTVYTVEAGKQEPSGGLVLKSGKFDMETMVEGGYFLDEAKVFVCSGIWPDWAKIAMFHFDRVDHPVNIGTPVDYYSNTANRRGRDA